MPKTTADVLACGAIEAIVRSIGVARFGIVLRLHEHRHLAPIACHTAGRIVAVPIVDIVAPFTGEIRDALVHLRNGDIVAVGGMGKQHFVIFMAASRGVAAR